MLPKFRSFVRPVIRSFVRSFVQIIFAPPLCCRNPIVRSFNHSIIHRSFIVPIHRSFIITIYHSSFVHTNYSPPLFTITLHRYYSPTLFIIVTIYHRYYSSMISMVTFLFSLFIVRIHRYYSSIIRSPQISTTHPSCCPVHLRPVRPIFQSYELQ
jgi:hypothetical protein